MGGDLLQVLTLIASGGAFWKLLEISNKMESRFTKLEVKQENFEKQLQEIDSDVKMLNQILPLRKGDKVS